MKVKFWGARGSIPTPMTESELQEKIKAAVEELRLRIPHLPPGIIFKKKSPGCSNASPPSDRSTSPNARSSAIVPGSQGPHLAKLSPQGFPCFFRSSIQP